MNQIDVYLKKADLSTLYSELAIKIHGCIMRLIPTEYASRLHRQELNPFSLFAIQTENGYIVRLSVLNKEAELLIEALASQKTLRIFGAEEKLQIERVECSRQIEFHDLCRLVTKRKYRVTITTPAMYKSKGKLCFDPSLANYFNSVVQKINRFEDKAFNMQDVYTAFEKVHIENYSFSNAVYSLNGHKINGLTGYADVKFVANGKELSLIQSLFSYATYAGIGGKTALGMGGFLLEER